MGGAAQMGGGGLPVRTPMPMPPAPIQGGGQAGLLPQRGHQRHDVMVPRASLPSQAATPPPPPPTVSTQPRMQRSGSRPRLAAAATQSSNTVAPALAPAAAVALTGEAGEARKVIDAVIASLAAQPLGKMEKRKLADVIKRATALYAILGGGAVSPSLSSGLASFCGSLQQRDLPSCVAVHAALCKSDWQGNSQWLPGLKTLVALVQARGV